MTPSSSLSSVSSNELVELGIDAIKSGNKTLAVKLLGEALLRDDMNDKAWIWLSGAVDTDAQKKFCLQHALTANPNSLVAKRGLDMLPATIQPISPLTLFVLEKQKVDIQPVKPVESQQPAQVSTITNQNNSSSRPFRKFLKGCLIASSATGGLVFLCMIAFIISASFIPVSNQTSSSARPTSETESQINPLGLAKGEVKEILQATMAAVQVTPTTIDEIPQATMVTVQVTPTTIDATTIAIMAPLGDDNLRSYDAIVLSQSFEKHGFNFKWKVAPNGKRIYQATNTDDVVITIRGAYKESFDGAAILGNITGDADKNNQYASLMSEMLHSFSGWEEGDEWLTESIKNWAKELEEEASVPKGLYTETRNNWKAQLFFVSPETLLLSVDRVKN